MLPAAAHAPEAGDAVERAVRDDVQRSATVAVELERERRQAVVRRDLVARGRVRLVVHEAPHQQRDDAQEDREEAHDGLGAEHDCGGVRLGEMIRPFLRGAPRARLRAAQPAP